MKLHKIEFFNKVDSAGENIFGYLDSKHYITAIFIFIANVLFKKYNLDNASLWLDEANNIYISLQTWNEIFERTINNSNGPIFFFISNIWQKIFGISVFSVRFLSVLFGSFSAVAIFYFARKYIDIRTAIFAVIIFTLSKIQFFYSHEARSYTFISFLTILSFYYLFKLFEKSNIKNLIILTIIYILLFHSHILVAIIIPIHFYIALLKYRQNKKAFIFVNSSLVFTTITLVIWVMANPWLGGKETVWGKIPTFQSFVNLMSLYSGSINNLYLLILVFIGYVSMTIYNYRKIKGFDYDKFVMFQSLLLWAILPVVVIYFVSVYYNPRFIPRYMLYATPGLYLLFAFLISQIKTSVLIKIGLLVFIITYSIKGINLNPYKGESWKEIVSYIKEKDYDMDSTLIVVSPEFQIPSFSYYYDIDAFKDYLNTVKILKKKNVFFPEDFSMFRKYKLENFRNIGLVLSQESIIDPERKMFNYVMHRSSIADFQEKYSGIKFYMFDTRIKKDSIYSFNSFESPELTDNLKTEDAKTGQYAFEIYAEKQFSPGYQSGCSDIVANQCKLINIEVWVKYSDPKINSQLVCSIENDEGFVQYRNLSIGKRSKPGDWQKIKWDVTIPDNISDNDRLKIYVWNPGKTKLLIDDLKITIR